MVFVSGLTVITILTSLFATCSMVPKLSLPLMHTLNGVVVILSTLLATSSTAVAIVIVYIIFVDSSKPLMFSQDIS